MKIKIPLTLLNEADKIQARLEAWGKVDVAKRLMAEIREKPKSQAVPAGAYAVFEILKHGHLIVGLNLYAYRDDGAFHSEMIIVHVKNSQQEQQARKYIEWACKKVNDDLHLPPPIEESPNQRQN